MIMPLHEKSIVSGRNVLGCWEVIAGSKRSIFLIGFVIRGRKAMTGSVFMKKRKNSEKNSGKHQFAGWG